MYANTDTPHGCGLDLIFPSVSPENFHGFPVIRAEIDFPGPSSPFGSYAQLFGWIQVVKIVPLNGTSKESGEWELDMVPWSADLGTPFAYWGHNPTAFDAPCRSPPDNGVVEEIIWRAQSFLCVLEDAAATKRVRVIRGTATGWGFDVSSVQTSDGKTERKITISPVEVLNLEEEWTARLELLRKVCPAFTFGEVPVE